MGVSPGPFTCMHWTVSFEHVGLNPVLVEGFPLRVVQGVAIWLVLVQVGMELSFVVQVQLQVPV